MIRPRRLPGRQEHRQDDRVAGGWRSRSAWPLRSWARQRSLVRRPYLSKRAVVATSSCRWTAANAITTLWTYTPENIDTLADRAANYLSGDFAAVPRFRHYAANKQAKITNDTEVTGAAVGVAGRMPLPVNTTPTTSPVTRTSQH